MATLTVRDVDEQVLARLKAAAAAHNRSLAGEVREALAAYVAAAEQNDDARARRQAWLERAQAIAARSQPGLGVADIMDEARADWDVESRQL